MCVDVEDNGAAINPTDSAKERDISIRILHSGPSFLRRHQCSKLNQLMFSVVHMKDLFFDSLYS